MALSTGTPPGTLITQEDIYIEGAPTIYFQSYSASLLKNPDSDGFYWGLSGTPTYPVYEMSCVSDVSFTEDVVLNEVLCDNVGIKDVTQQRQFVEFQFAVKSLFPLSSMSQFLSLGTVVQNAGEDTEKVGIGKINNSAYWHVWAPAIYDESVGDYIGIHLNRAKFVDAWTIPMPFGEGWRAEGLKLRALVDSTKPVAQAFGVLIRHDASAL